MLDMAGAIYPKAWHKVYDDSKIELRELSPKQIVVYVHRTIDK